jgi:hypothetical protein
MRLDARIETYDNSLEKYTDQEERIKIRERLHDLETSRQGFLNILLALIQQKTSQPGKKQLLYLHPTEITKHTF